MGTIRCDNVRGISYGPKTIQKFFLGPKRVKSKFWSENGYH